MNVINSEDAAMSGARYARCIEASKRVRWDIDKDVNRKNNLPISRALI